MKIQTNGTLWFFPVLLLILKCSEVSDDDISIILDKLILAGNRQCSEIEKEKSMGIYYPSLEWGLRLGLTRKQ